MLGMSDARSLMRKSEEAYASGQLTDDRLTQGQLISAMIEHPKLIERPIVVHQGQARIGDFIMQYQQKRKYSRVISVSAYIALMAYLVISTMASEATGFGLITIIGIKCFPLLGFAFAVYIQHLRQLAWMCFILLIYFTLEVIPGPENGFLGALIITLLYASTMFHIRWHNRANEEAKAA